MKKGLSNRVIRQSAAIFRNPGETRGQALLRVLRASGAPAHKIEAAKKLG